MSEETLFPADEKTPGQTQSRRAYEVIHEELSKFAWWQDYLWARQRGWDWRKAILIAWGASPLQNRQPATQDALAKEVLGLASDRMFATWRQRYPQLDHEIAYLQAAPLLRHRRDIYEALVKSAIAPNPQNHPDRKLALELLGDYVPKSRQQSVGADDGPIETKTTIEIVYAEPDDSLDSA
jgi:hypothetical protein